ncbi:MAG TPA: hypothetical protein VEL76_07625 [Gemmataceae bacterium]|nr:hypothetical protein [Gemmataceae bacterium]
MNLDTRLKKIEARANVGGDQQIMGIALDVPGKGDLVWRGPVWRWMPCDRAAVLAEARSQGGPRAKLLTGGIDPDEI